MKEDNFLGSPVLVKDRKSFKLLKESIAKGPIVRHFDLKLDLHVMIFANVWVLSSTLMQFHDHKLHPVRFCGRVLKDNEKNYHPAKRDVLALLKLIKIAHTLFVKKTIHVYTRYSTLEWVFTSKSLYCRAVSFAVLLAPYPITIKRFSVRDVNFLQLL